MIIGNIEKMGDVLTKYGHDEAVCRQGAEALFNMTAKSSKFQKWLNKQQITFLNEQRTTK